MKRSFSAIVAFVLFLLSGNVLLNAQSQTNDRAEWFVDARFGMFIHWGVYSGAEGFWKGEKLRYDNDYAEWIRYRNRIDREEYLTLLENFDWDRIDPEQWVILAKQAGMKYVTLTAKHHDGFGLWDSQVGEYDMGDFTSPKRDIVGELAAACRKHGLKLGLYYSHWVDWEHPYGWDHTREVYGLEPEQFDQYWQKKVIPQMRELLTNYGDIGLIWFDMWIHHSETIVTKEQLLQLKQLIRELQPDCLVNSRLGLSLEEDNDVDFQTLGDTQLEAPARFGSIPAYVPVQSPSTFRWRIYIDRPSERPLDVSYSYQGEARTGKITARMVGTQVEHTIATTGKTIGEPNRDWVINSFESNRLGVIDFPAAGYYEVVVEIVPPKGEEVSFQWVWLGK